MKSTSTLNWCKVKLVGCDDWFFFNKVSVIKLLNILSLTWKALYWKEQRGTVDLGSFERSRGIRFFKEYNHKEGILDKSASTYKPQYVSNPVCHHVNFWSKANSYSIIQMPEFIGRFIVWLFKVAIQSIYPYQKCCTSNYSCQYKLVPKVARVNWCNWLCVCCEVLIVGKIKTSC